MAEEKNTKKILSDEEIRKLVMARLSVLSKTTMISWDQMVVLRA